MFVRDASKESGLKSLDIDLHKGRSRQLSFCDQFRERHHFNLLNQRAWSVGVRTKRTHGRTIGTSRKRKTGTHGTDSDVEDLRTDAVLRAMSFAAARHDRIGIDGHHRRVWLVGTQHTCEPANVASNVVKRSMTARQGPYRRCDLRLEGAREIKLSVNRVPENDIKLQSITCHYILDTPTIPASTGLTQQRTPHPPDRQSAIHPACKVKTTHLQTNARN